MKKVFKNVKVLLEESSKIGVVKTKDPQIVEREWVFSGKIQFELQDIRHQPMKHNYYKIISFQYFPFDQELLYTDT